MAFVIDDNTLYQGIAQGSSLAFSPVSFDGATYTPVYLPLNAADTDFRLVIQNSGTEGTGEVLALFANETLVDGQPVALGAPEFAWQPYSRSVRPAVKASFSFALPQPMAVSSSSFAALSSSGFASPSTAQSPISTTGIVQFSDYTPEPSQPPEPGQESSSGVILGSVLGVVGVGLAAITAGVVLGLGYLKYRQHQRYKLN